MTDAAPELTAAEAYSLWGERIRCLFAAAPTYVDTALAHNPYERHVEHPTSLSTSFPQTSQTREHVAEQPQRNSDNGGADSSAYFYDAALYPLCFYARLLQTERGAAWSSAADSTAAASVGGDAPARRLAELRVDDDVLATRLAAQLRARNRAAVAQLQARRAVETAPLVSSFCDPKVEEQQALLHTELTEFLLEVRERNKASTELRRQLQLSRVVHERVRDAQDNSKSV